MKENLCVLLFFICGQLMLAGAGTATGQQWYDTIDQQLDQVMQEAMDKYGIPGMVVGVWVPGYGDWVKTRGVSNRSTGRSMEAGNTYRIASVSKTFGSTVILQLADDGLLNLDQTIDQYEFAANVPNKSEITIRMLCNHSSGLYSFLEDQPFLDAVGADLEREWTLPELMEYGVSHPPYFPPGTDFHYSQTNYVLMQMIIEHVTGNSFADELQRRICEPLGLSNTMYPEGITIPGDYSHGYMENEITGELDDVTELNPSFASAAGGGLVSNVYDLKVWAKALADGTLLSERMQRERLTFFEVPPSFGYTEYGLGLRNSGGCLGHDGEMVGFNSCMYYLPSWQATIILMLNRHGAPTGSEADIIYKQVKEVLFSCSVLLQVDINGSRIPRGATVSIGASIGYVDYPFDAYAVIRKPDGNFLSMSLNKSLRRGKKPLARNVPGFGEASSYIFLQRPIPLTLPTGRYQIIVGLVEPGKSPKISNALDYKVAWIVVEDAS